LAVVVTAAKGHDLDYIWKTQGQASAARTPGGYYINYINAAQAGEPPGRWWGLGARALGFTSGQVVERKPYDAVYQQRDPRTGDKLGRPRGRAPASRRAAIRISAGVRTLTTAAWARAPLDDHRGREAVVRREIAQLGA
jgi:hypothetical protein